MNTEKKIVRFVGALFIIGTVAGILSLVFTGVIQANTDLLTKISANENQIIIGTLFMLIMGFSLALIPIIIYPVLKKYNEILALGYVVFRGALETVTYIATAICWLLLVVLGKEYIKTGSPDISSYRNMGNLLLGASIQINSITMIVFSLGALMFYYLLYQSKLIPRWLSVWGLVAIILYLATGVLSLFGPDFTFLLMPLALQEMFMAVWLIVKGFNPTAIASETEKTI